MAFTYKESQMVKGMLARGDRQHDIASYFGVNGGRIAEISTGNCDYPTAPALPENKLPPAGPYVGAKTVFEIKSTLSEARELIELAGDGNEDSKVATDALDLAISKL